MAAVSYLVVSPSFMLALLGKVRGWDKVTPTPVRDWRTATVDVAIPAHNEEAMIGLALDSVLRQDTRPRKIIVVDDGSKDATSAVASRFAELSGCDIEIRRHKKSEGKTTGIREACESSDADVLFVLDGDTVLVDKDYLSRSVEELFRNAGVASVCGEVMPLVPRTVSTRTKETAVLRQLAKEYSPVFTGHVGTLKRVLTFFTIVYRTALYLFLHRILYDGHMKLTGGTLNPAGCAVAYRRDRLAECFAYARPRVGDNLSVSEDIYIGHFFNWKGYRNVHIGSVRCESTEPPVTRLGKQMFLWSSAFLQALYYFPSLPLTVFKLPNVLFRRKNTKDAERRRAREQYRAPWSEAYTRRFGRPVGLLDTMGLVEKVTFPVILGALALLAPRTFLITVFAEACISSLSVALVADSGRRMRSAAMMAAATPLRYLSMGVDMFSVATCGLDIARGNRDWRK
jgi:glycosyltransferase involved in cell wall biosynthesis